MRQQKINYQKELEKTLGSDRREAGSDTFCFIAAVVRAAVM